MRSLNFLCRSNKGKNYTSMYNLPCIKTGTLVALNKIPPLILSKLCDTLLLFLLFEFQYSYPQYIPEKVNSGE